MRYPDSLMNSTIPVNSQNDYTRAISREEMANLPIRRYEGGVCLVTTPQDRARALADLRHESVVGFDTETRPSFRKGGSGTGTRSSLTQAGVSIHGKECARSGRGRTALRPRPDRAAQPRRDFPGIPGSQRQPHVKLGRGTVVRPAGHLRRDGCVGVPRIVPAFPEPGADCTIIVR